MYVTSLDAGQRDFILSEVNGNLILETSDFVALLVNLPIAALQASIDMVKKKSAW